MTELSETHPLRRMFAGLTEHAFFEKFGVADPELIDYLSGLLTRFVHSDSVFSLRNGRGRPMTELVEMVNEATNLPEGGVTRRDYFKHIGDFTLFWTGVYPEALDPNHQRLQNSNVFNYSSQGKRSYLIASSFEDDRFRFEAPVLKRLAEEFELCACGLREVRREWEEMQACSSNGKIIRA